MDSATLQRGMTYTLVVLYGFAWALIPSRPLISVGCIFLLCNLITFPYFCWGFLERWAAAFFIGAVLLILGSLCPPLDIVLLTIWGLLCLLIKGQGLLRNIPLIFGGFLLYVAPMVATGVFRSNVFTFESQQLSSIFVKVVTVIMGSSFLVDEIQRYSPILIGVDMVILGSSIMVVALCICERFGYQRSRSAALLLGSSSYLLCFLLSFFLPGFSPGDSGDGGFDG